MVKENICFVSLTAPVRLVIIVFISLTAPVRDVIIVFVSLTAPVRRVFNCSNKKAVAVL